MTLDEFLDMQPHYFARLIEREDQLHKRTHGRTQDTVELMVAQLIAMVANTAQRKVFREMCKPEQFMPSEWAKAAAVQPRRRSRKRRDRLVEDMRTWMRQIGTPAPGAKS
jgi:hypothetical protein